MNQFIVVFMSNVRKLVAPISCFCLVLGGSVTQTLSDGVYLQHDFAVMHVRLPEPQLQQLHVTNLPANAPERTNITP